MARLGPAPRSGRPGLHPTPERGVPPALRHRGASTGVVWQVTAHDQPAQLLVDGERGDHEQLRLRRVDQQARDLGSRNEFQSAATWCSYVCGCAHRPRSGRSPRRSRVDLGATTSTRQNEAGESVTTVTDPVTLRWSFYGLAALSIIVYLGGRWRGRAKPTRLDVARGVIPPAAFVVWTMLQKSTAFDAVAPDLRYGARYAIGLFGAVTLGVLAAWLAVRADQTSPTRQT